MERMDDIGKKITLHLRSVWGRTFLCTTQEVRESITASLLGIRSKLQSEESLPRAELLRVQKRIGDIRDQIHVLIARRDRRHVTTFIRIVRSYERRLNDMSGDALR